MENDLVLNILATSVIGSIAEHVLVGGGASTNARIAVSPEPGSPETPGSGLERNVRRTQFGKLAVPREARQRNEFNALRYCLGKKRLIVFQGVSEWPPKPESRGSKVAADFPVTVEWQVQIRDRFEPMTFRL
jgi:hypothetical protein